MDLAISRIAQRNLAQDVLIISKMNSVLTLIFHKERLRLGEKEEHIRSGSGRFVEYVSTEG
jgi:hypothetical protein